MEPPGSNDCRMEVEAENYQWLAQMGSPHLLFGSDDRPDVGRCWALRGNLGFDFKGNGSWISFRNIHDSHSNIPRKGKEGQQDGRAWQKVIRLAKGLLQCHVHTYKVAFGDSTTVRSGLLRSPFQTCHWKLLSSGNWPRTTNLVYFFRAYFGFQFSCSLNLSAILTSLLVWYSYLGVSRLVVCHQPVSFDSVSNLAFYKCTCLRLKLKMWFCKKLNFPSNNFTVMWGLNLTLAP